MLTVKLSVAKKNRLKIAVDRGDNDKLHKLFHSKKLTPDRKTYITTLEVRHNFGKGKKARTKMFCSR